MKWWFSSSAQSLIEGCQIKNFTALDFIDNVWFLPHCLSHVTLAMSTGMILSCYFLCNMGKSMKLFQTELTLIVNSIKFEMIFCSAIVHFAIRHCI